MPGSPSQARHDLASAMEASADVPTAVWDEVREYFPATVREKVDRVLRQQGGLSQADVGAFFLAEYFLALEDAGLSGGGDPRQRMAALRAIFRVVSKGNGAPVDASPVRVPEEVAAAALPSPDMGDDFLPVGIDDDLDDLDDEDEP